jgi:hypothetical protein
MTRAIHRHYLAKDMMKNEVRLLMAQLEFKKPIGLNELEFKRRIQQVPCRDRWTGRCLNQECWSFQNVNGDYYCIKDGLPANPR